MFKWKVEQITQQGKILMGKQLLFCPATYESVARVRVTPIMKTF